MSIVKDLDELKKKKKKSIAYIQNEGFTTI